MLVVRGIGNVVAQVEVTPSANQPWGPKIQTLLNWLAQWGLWGALAGVLLGGATMIVAKRMAHSSGMSLGLTAVMLAGAGAFFLGIAAPFVNTLYSIEGS